MKKTLAQQLKSDKRISHAKKSLGQVLASYQKQVKGIKPANPKLSNNYQKLLEQCAQLRGGKLYYPYLGSGFGKGALVELADGSVKYDFITGIGVHYLGHNNPKLLNAMIDAVFEDAVLQGNLQQNESTVEVLKLLTGLATKNGSGLRHCFLTSSGAMANENALKIIFQKREPANRLLAFRRCFAGRTMVLTQMTDRPDHRIGLPKVIEIDYVPFYDAQNPQQSTDEAVKSLEEYIKRFPGQHAGMCFELIQGEGGYYAGDHHFFAALMKILKTHNIAVMVDEIQTFGRTSEPFAFEHFRIDSLVDVVTVGKLTQVCATLFTDEYLPKPGLVSQTFTSSSSAIAAARVILKEMISGKYFGKNGKILKLSSYFVNQLSRLNRQYPRLINGPFGLGAMVGITVLDGSKEKTRMFLQELFKQGVIAFEAGQNPSRVRFLMPIGAVTTNDIDQAVKIIESTLRKIES